MRTVLIVTLLLALPLVGAQTHEHDRAAGYAFVLHDGPDSGRAVVGGFTHFGFALIDKDGGPIAHQNAEILVVQNGQTVFQTADTHEYDGIFSFDYTFTKPGAYTVMAMSGEMIMGTFEGVAVAPVNETVASIVFEPKLSGNTMTAKLNIVDGDGVILTHTDAIIEIRRELDLQVVARHHAHIHDGPIEFTQAFQTPGDHIVLITAYKAFATGRSTDIRAIVGVEKITIAGGAAPPAATLPSVPAPLSPIGAKASAGDFTLHATYDPQNQVGVGQQVRISGLVTNATALPQPHVDFTFNLNGPTGLVFSTKTLHEYDGHFEYAFTPMVAGIYSGTMTASTGEGDLSVPIQFEVVPPVVAGLTGAGSAGVGVVNVQGLDAIVAGEPTELTFSVMSPAGPVQHSEVDVMIFHDDEAPIYRFKLHTHASGLTKATVVFPHAGDEWVILVDAIPTVPQPIVFSGPGGPGTPPVFIASVAPGVPGVTTTESGADDATPTASIPGVGFVLALSALAAVALISRRR